MHNRSKLATTHGKNGVPELPAFREHIHFMTLVIFFTDDDGRTMRTKPAIAFRVSDADLREN